MSNETQGDSDNWVTLTYPTGESETFELIEVLYDRASGEYTMIMQAYEETDEHPGDGRAVPQGQ